MNHVTSGDVQADLLRAKIALAGPPEPATPGTAPTASARHDKSALESAQQFVREHPLASMSAVLATGLILTKVSPARLLLWQGALIAARAMVARRVASYFTR